MEKLEMSTPAPTERQADTAPAANAVSADQELVSILEGALVPDLVKYHSAEWLVRARAAIERYRSPVAANASMATLECPSCGTDRLKAPCPRMADECAMVADAHLLAGQRPAAANAEGRSEPRTLMTDDAAQAWAWDQVKLEVGTSGWTAGDSCNYYGFFLWGWRYRAQYERQRPAAADAVDLTDTLGTVLWMQRRLPRTYGLPDFVEKVIRDLARATGADVTESLAEAQRAAATSAGGVSNSRIIEIAYENGMKVRTGQGAIKFARAIIAELDRPAANGAHAQEGGK